MSRWPIWLFVKACSLTFLVWYQDIPFRYGNIPYHHLALAINLISNSVDNKTKQFHTTWRDMSLPVVFDVMSVSLKLEKSRNKKTPTSFFSIFRTIPKTLFGNFIISLYIVCYILPTFAIPSAMVRIIQILTISVFTVNSEILSDFHSNLLIHVY